MNEKLNHSDLIAMLAKDAGISLAKADAFTKALFDIIIEGLEQDGIVKINGLGTFKITDVADRYSVNVNTGEKFEIKGHKKLTFIPAENLKEIVNRPFAMFEPVEIDDSYQEEIETVQEDETNENEEVAETLQPKENEKTKTADEGKRAVEEIAPEKTEDENSVGPGEKTGPLPVEDDKEGDDGTVTAEEEITPEERIPVEEEKSEENIVADNVDEKKEATEDTKPEEARRKDKEADSNARRGRSGKNALLAIIAVIALGLAYYWFMEKESGDDKHNPLVLADTRDRAQEDKPDTKAQPVVEKTAEEPADSIVPKDTAENAVQQIPENARPVVEQGNTQDEYSFAMLDGLAAINDRDITDADTTLYISVGELAVHVVAEDERLAKISNDYYGSRKLWPYIAKYNNLKKPYGITVGMKLVIPELQPR